MPRVAGVNIPGNKKIPYALQYIYGLGRVLAWEVCKKANLDVNKKADDLTDEEMGVIRQLLDNDFVVEGALRREIKMNIKRLQDIGSYRGTRHKRGLPARGQSSKTNARTRKGPRKTVAGKKKAPTK